MRLLECLTVLREYIKTILNMPVISNQFFVMNQTSSRMLLNQNDFVVISPQPLQCSMRSHISNGCSVMEGDLSSDWTGGGLLLEQPVLWLRVR